MALSNDYVTKEPTRAAIDALDAPTVLEFSTAWCGYCQAAQPFIAAAFADYPQISHIKVEDGRGRPLDDLLASNSGRPWCSSRRARRSHGWSGRRERPRFAMQ